MKLYIDMSGKQAQVSRDPEPKKDQNGNQKSERDTGRPMWSTQVVILDQTGAEVISVTTAGTKPDVTVGQIVSPVQLEAMPWSTNGKSGVAYRAIELVVAASAASRKGA